MTYRHQSYSPWQKPTLKTCCSWRVTFKWSKLRESGWIKKMRILYSMKSSFSFIVIINAVAAINRIFLNITTATTHGEKGVLFRHREILPSMFKCKVDGVFVNKLKFRLYILKADNQSNETHIKQLKMPLLLKIDFKIYC